MVTPEWYIARCRPRIGRDFILTARGLLTEEIRADLERLRDFTFQQHPKIQAEQVRLDALSGIVQKRIRQILE